MKRYIDCPLVQAHKRHTCLICGETIQFAEMHHRRGWVRAHKRCARRAADNEKG